MYKKIYNNNCKLIRFKRYHIIQIFLFYIANKVITFLHVDLQLLKVKACYIIYIFYIMLYKQFILFFFYVCNTI
jgi:hypothetical protein